MTALVHHPRDSTVSSVVDRRHTVDAPSHTVAGDHRSEIGAGVRSTLPWLVGVVPFGMVVRMNARTSALPTAVGLAAGSTIYSGSAQLAAIELLGGGADIVVVVSSVPALDTRLLLYGSSFAPHWRDTSRRFRAIGSFLLIDPSFAVGISGYRQRPAGEHISYLAAGVTLWVAWHASVFGGVALGAGVP